MLYLIQNDPTVPPGNIPGHLHVPHRVIHPYQGEVLPDMAEVSALIVLGGSMGACDDGQHPFLTKLKELIRGVVERDIPYLGICLGGQLLAAAMGAEVASNRWGEKGPLTVDLTTEGQSDMLFEGISAAFRTFQWHNDSFDIPAGGTRLALSRSCPNQAFRFGRCAWGLQFHPEVMENIVREWAGGNPSKEQESERLVAEFNAIAEEYDATAGRIVRNFTRLAAL